MGQRNNGNHLCGKFLREYRGAVPLEKYHEEHRKLMDGYPMEFLEKFDE